jgi:uncharacterized protein (DUF2141 family)
MFQAYPVSGSFSRPAVNINAGAVTGFSSVLEAPQKTTNRMETKIQILLIWLFVSWSGSSFAEQDPGTLGVHVKGAVANTGQVILSLYTSADNYLKAPVLSETLPVNAEGEARFTIEGIEEGRYSVGIVYDKDGNGKLNTGFLRIPKEPVGFSNNAKGRFGPPGFDKTAFDFSGSQAIVITLVEIKK